LARGHEELAAAELRTAAELGGLDLDLGLKLADLEVAAGDAAAARRILQALTTTHPSPRALVKLAELTWPTGPPKSLPILLQALALAPNSEEILGHTANTYLAADEPEKALETLVPLMTLSPDVVVYVRLLGEAYTKLGRLEEATATLREAIALEPSYLRSRIHLAGVLLHRKRFDEAETELHEILAIDPERPEAKDLLEFLETARSSQPPAHQ
jgi:tetratricopeptide (TPR) repeat protein